MNKKNLLILLCAVLAVLVAVAILVAVSLNQQGATTPAGGENTQPSNDEPTIGVEETEPSLGGDTEIDFDDLIDAGEEDDDDDDDDNDDGNNKKPTKPNESSEPTESSDDDEGEDEVEETTEPKKNNEIDFDDLVNLG